MSIYLATDPWSAAAQALAVTATNTLSSSRNNLRSTIPSSHHSHMSSPRSPHAAAHAPTLPRHRNQHNCQAWKSVAEAQGAQTEMSA
jgi:hypothetical protein